MQQIGSEMSRNNAEMLKKSAPGLYELASNGICKY